MKKALSIFLCMVLLACMMLTLTGPALAADGSTTVYVTNTGECYHSAGCQYLKKSCIAISLEDAVSQGYRACSKCSPPALTYSAPASTYKAPATYSNYSSPSTVQDYGYDTADDMMTDLQMYEQTADETESALEEKTNDLNEANEQVDELNEEIESLKNDKEFYVYGIIGAIVLAGYFYTKYCNKKEELKRLKQLQK